MLKRDKRFNKVFWWVSYSIVLPLLPLVFGLFVAFLRNSTVSRSELFGGTELIFFAVTVLATTKNDLDNSGIPSSGSILYAVFSVLLLLALIFAVFFFAIVYLEQNVVGIGSLGLNRETTTDAAIWLAISSTIVTFSLQLLIAAVTKEIRLTMTEAQEK